MADERDYAIEIGVEFDQASAAQALRGVEDFERRIQRIVAAQLGAEREPLLSGQLEPTYRPLGRVTPAAVPGPYQLPAGGSSPYNPALRVPQLPPGERVAYLPQPPPGPAAPYVRQLPAGPSQLLGMVPPGPSSPYIRPLPPGPSAPYEPLRPAEQISYPRTRPAGSLFDPYSQANPIGLQQWERPLNYGPAGATFGGAGGSGPPPPPPPPPSPPPEEPDYIRYGTQAFEALRAAARESVEAFQALRVAIDANIAAFKSHAELGRGLGILQSGVSPERMLVEQANITAENIRRTAARGAAIGEGHDQDYLDALAAVRRGVQDLTDARAVARYHAQGGEVAPELLQHVKQNFPGVVEDAVATEQARLYNQAKRVELQRQQGLRSEAEQMAGLLEEQLQAASLQLSAEKRALRARKALAERAASEPGSVSEEALRLIPDEELQAARDAETRRATYEERAGVHARTRDYFYNPDASFTERLAAGVAGHAPGETVSEKVPFGAQFLEGFFGRDSAMELALGQAAKFSLLYGGLYRAQALVTQGFVAAAKGASDYEEALISLNQATGQTSDANADLARSASTAGTAMGFGPAAGVTAAAQAVGLYDLNNATPYDRQQIAQQSVEVSGRLSRVGGQDIQTTQEELAGVIRSFNLSPYDQSRLEDQLTYVSRATGRGSGDILNATAQLGTIASTAGYDPAEAMAMVARIATTTGQTANAVAGQLSQVLSRAGDPAVLQRLAAVGVDTQGTTLKQQIQQLSQLNLDNNTRSYTVQAFGRSRSGQSFDILLNQLGNINQLASGARNAPAGLGERTFGNVMDSFAKQMQVIGGHLQSIANTLADLGFFDTLKLGLAAIATFAEALDNLLKIVGQLPGPLKELIGVTATLVAVERAYAFAQGVRGALNAAAEGEGAVANAVRGFRSGAGGGLLSSILPKAGAATAGEAVAAAGAATTVATVAEEGVATEAQLAAIRTTLANAGIGEAAAGGAAATAAGGVAEIAGPVAVALAIAFGLIQSQYGGRSGAQASLEADATARQAQAGAGTPQELKEAADRFDAAVRQAQKNQDLSLSSFMEQGFAPFERRFLQLIHVQGGNPDAQIEAEDQAAAARLRQQATDLAAAQQAAVARDPSAAFGDFGTVEGVSNALKTLGQNGYTASMQLAAINQAFENLIRVGARVPDAAAIVGSGQDTVFTTAAGAIPGKALASVTGRLQNEVNQLGPPDTSAFDFLGDAALVGSSDPAAGVRGLDEKNLAAVKAIDPARLRESADDIAKNILATAPRDASGQAILSQADIDKYQDRINKSAVDALNATGKAYTQDAVTQLTTAQKQGITGLVQQFGGSVATPERVDAYVQSAIGLAQQDAAQAAQIARDPRVQGRELLKNLRQQRQNVTDYISELPHGTADERATQALKLAEAMQTLDASIGQTLDQEVQTRFAEIDAAVAIRQSHYAAGDQMGRLNETIRGINQKLAVTIPADTTPTSVKPDTGAPSTTQPGGLSKQVNAQLGAFGVDTSNLSGVSTQLSSQLGAFGVSTTTGVAGAPDQPVAPPVSELSAYERYQLEQQKAEAASQQLELQRQDRANQYLLAVQPGDAAGIAAAQNRAAQEDLAKARRDVRTGQATPEYVRQLELQARQTEGANLQAGVASQTVDFQSRLDVDDPLADQKIRLQQATGQIALAKRHYVDMREAQMAYNKANHDLIEAQIQLAAETRSDYDRTNPLQQARAELSTLHQQYNAATNKNEKARLANQIAVKNSETDVTDSQQRVQRIDDYETLGKITHQSAQAARIAERNRIDTELAGMKDTQTGYYALQQQSISLAKEIKSASSQYSGQFNLRDIKLPTVYEIRRSMGATGMTTNSGDFITNNVQINGADFAKVVDYLQSLLGRNVGRSRGLAGRTVG